MSSPLQSLLPAGIFPDDDPIEPEELLRGLASDIETQSHGRLQADIVRKSSEHRVDLEFDVVVRNGGRRLTLLAVARQVASPYPVAVDPPKFSLPDYLKSRRYVPERRRSPAEIAMVYDSEMRRDPSAGTVVENRWVAHSPSELQALLKEIFASSEVKAALISLYASSRIQPPSQTENPAAQMPA